MEHPATTPPAAPWVERRAKLFEAGEYPDKGLSVTAQDLASLAERFEGPVPVLIEHAESPLHLGELASVEAVGGELFGTVRLTEEADRLARRSGASSLSVALSPDLSRILEVSLVRHPRVPDARLFGQGPVFHAAWPGQPLSPESRALLDELQRGGRLAPAQRPFAEALLACSQKVAFDGSAVPVAALVRALLERQPPSALLAEVAPARASDESHLLLPEEEAFYRRYFPDVDLAEIARRRSR
ncbi:MAG: hypothetical protein N2109_06895 [Fimbriimonadales bacterium]|nr:hypothetical protein [Fimbriimonadales bacterium]